jgi:uncharacterized protein
MSRLRLFILCVFLVVLGCKDGIHEDQQLGERGDDQRSLGLAAGGNPGLPGLGPADLQLTDVLNDAVSSRGSQYTARTRHLDPTGKPKYTNRLILESSPYLVQHAHNPVNWFPWGEQAFDRARAEGKPVLMSIGYSTCHWCHVMERESFEDPEIAAFINQHFIAIKVDREERPDVDAIYMRAVRILTGRGGWPMTVALTPDREPFFGGTYFPPKDGARGGRKGFLTVLRELKERYEEAPEEVIQQAQGLSRRLQDRSGRMGPQDIADSKSIERAARALARGFDQQWGGFGKSKKFPRPSHLQLLLRYHHRTGDSLALEIVEKTLNQMADGGIHDHLGGGFHRYSVDRRWFVPHFEKMLYDNAQLAVVYLEAWQANGNEDFAKTARGILNYVQREMTHPRGGFYSATDADSPVPGQKSSGGHPHEEEGWFFTWTPSELKELLGMQQAKSTAAWFGVKPGGNFEGRSILMTQRKPSVVAAELGISEEQLKIDIEAARPVLLRARNERPPPGLDDKILTAWNGLMISAFARAGLALSEEGYTRSARNAAVFVLDNMRKEERLYRSWHDGQLRYNAYLEDHAFLAQGLLDLHEATGELRWLNEAISLQAELHERFADVEGGAFYRTSDDHEVLLARDKPSNDGAIPSGNSVALLNLLRLAEITGETSYTEQAEQGLRSFGAQLRSGSTSMTLLLTAVDFLLDRPLEIVLIAPNSRANLNPMLQTVGSLFLPNRSLLRATEGRDLHDKQGQIPLLQSRSARGGEVTAYVCREGLCKLPTNDPGQLKEQLAETDPLRTPPPEPLQSPSNDRQPPAAWHYDKAGNRHWNPEHDHWHKGPPPEGRGQ